MDTADDSGWTPLQSAASVGASELVQLLIQQGAQVDRENNTKWYCSCHTLTADLTLTQHGPALRRIEGVVAGGARAVGLWSGSQQIRTVRQPASA